MRVGLVWENFEYGGVTIHLESLLNNKNFKNYKFTIFTNKKNSSAEYLKKKLKRKITIKYYNSYNVIFFNSILFKLFFFIIRPILFLFSIIQFYNILRNSKFDILLGNCGGYGDFRSEVSALLAASFLNIPVKLLLIHHSYSKPLFWQPLIKFIDKILNKRINGIIFVSKAVKKNIKSNTHLLKENIRNKIIYNGIVINNLKKNRNNLDKIIKKKKNIFNIGMISRIEKKKGHIDLIDSFYKLPETDKNKLTVYLIGKGSKKFIIFLKKKITYLNLEKQFIFTGFLKNESLHIAKKLNLLMSLTKDFEGFGLSLAEALYAGTPVLATKVGAVTEFLNKKNSFLIKPNNPQQITKALSDFVKNHKNWKKRALGGKRYITNHFSTDIMSRNFDTFFKSYFINR